MLRDRPRTHFERTQKGGVTAVERFTVHVAQVTDVWLQSVFVQELIRDISDEELPGIRQEGRASAGVDVSEAGADSPINCSFLKSAWLVARTSHIKAIYQAYHIKNKVYG